MIWLIGAIILVIPISFIFLWIKADVNVIVRNDSDFQGVDLKISSRFYKLDRSFDCTDPHLNLFEMILFFAFQERQRYTSMVKASQEDPSLPKPTFLPKIVGSLLQNSQIFTLLSFTVIEKMEWFSVIGGQDPCDAAIKSGITWGIKGSLLGWLSVHCKIDYLKAYVQPNFANPEYTSNFRCILKMRLVHIIIIELFVIVLKVRWWIDGFRAANPAQSSY